MASQQHAWEGNFPWAPEFGNQFSSPVASSAANDTISGATILEENISSAAGSRSQLSSPFASSAVNDISFGANTLEEENQPSAARSGSQLASSTGSPHVSTNGTRPVVDVAEGNVPPTATSRSQPRVVNHILIVTAFNSFVSRTSEESAYAAIEYGS